MKELTEKDYRRKDIEFLVCLVLTFLGTIAVVTIATL